MNRLRTIYAMMIVLGLTSGVARAEVSPTVEGLAPPINNSSATPDNAVLITVFMRHDQSKPLAELNAKLNEQKFFENFPPAGMEVVSWTVTMGIGQVIVVRLPAGRVRELNRVFDSTTWGPYRTEFYITYDIKSVGLALHEKAVGEANGVKP